MGATAEQYMTISQNFRRAAEGHRRLARQTKNPRSRTIDLHLAAKNDAEADRYAACAAEREKVEYI